MSLRVGVKRKLFYHSCCNKHIGIFQHNGVYHCERHKPRDRYFIHRTPFLSSNGAVRLLSMSLSKFHVLSRLTSYFTQKKEKVENPKDVSTDNVYQGESAQVSAQAVDDSSNILHKHSWMSLLDKLPFSSPFNISTPVKTSHIEQLSADVKKREDLRKEIFESTETFLQNYNTNLDLILKKATPTNSLNKLKERAAKQQNKIIIDNKKALYKNIKYPVIKVNKLDTIKTAHFEETKQVLQSIGIPCDELESYPAVQDMSRDTILICVNALKEKGIHVIFSLFLIDRIYLELKLQQEKESNPKKHQAKPLPLTSFRRVKAYLELCQLLDKPDLDIRNLLEQLAVRGQFPNILKLHKKVKDLRTVGATPQDILSNLEIMQGYEFFDEKIELYKKSPHVGQGPFPVHLFLAKSMNSFKEQLALGTEVDEIAKLLGVSVSDFQTCWGFKYTNLNKLQYKIHMCLAAGISHKDIFNNLGALVGLTVEQCHAVMSSFRDSGLPASLFVLREVVQTAKLSGSNCCGVDDKQKSADMSGDEAVEEDWIGDTKATYPEDLPATIHPMKTQHTLSLRKKELSTKKHRRAIFNLIKHWLNLDSAIVSGMFDCHINVSSVDLLDIPKNLDYLIYLNFTKHQIAMCPLVLANPHSVLIRVVKEAECLVLMQLQSTFTSSGSLNSLSSTSSSSSSLVLSTGSTTSKDQLKDSLFSRPLHRLNMYQYFMERENSFSLASTECERISGFLNV